MTREPGTNLRELFDALVELKPEQRRAFLDAREIGADERTELERLLSRADVEATAFLERPAVDHTALWGSMPPSQREHSSGVRIGKYTIVRLIAMGGMGAVYEATQDSPRRTVALKLIRADLLSEPAVRRFEREADILGSLRHRGIAQIFEAGVHQPTGGHPTERGVPFLAMEYLQGALQITEHARAHRLGLRARVECLALVCDALQHAHDHGVVHRDLKPGNILVDPSGEPKLIDFGVARLADSVDVRSTVTGTGAFVGTMRYMSPEQCGRAPSGATVRSDIYAMGVVMYELLAGRAPLDLDNQSLLHAARMIAEDPPVRPSIYAPAIRGDLETVVLKCLEKDSSLRYASASELALDLRRWLNDEPVRARPPSLTRQLRSLARRNRAFVAGVAGVILALVVGLAGTSIQLLRARRAEQAAGEARRVAETERDSAQTLAYQASIAAAASALAANDGGVAMDHLSRAPQSLRNWEWRYLADRADTSEEVLPASEGRHTQYAAAHPTSGRIVLANASGTIDVLDKDGVREQIALDEPDRAAAVSGSITDDGNRVLLSSMGQFSVFDTTQRRVIRRLHRDDSAELATLSPDGRWIVNRSADGTSVSMWNVEDGRLVWSRDDAPRAAEGVSARAEVAPAFGPGGSVVANVENGRFVVRRARDGSIQATAQLCPQARTEISGCFSPDLERFACWSGGSDVTILSVKSGEIARTLAGHTLRPTCAAFDQGCHRVVTGSIDKSLRVWDLKSGGLPTVLLGFHSAVHGVQFFDGSTRVIATSWGGEARTWRLDRTPNPTLPLFVGNGNVALGMAFSPDGTSLWGARNEEPSGTDPGSTMEIAIWDRQGQLQARCILPRAIQVPALDPAHGRVTYQEVTGVVSMWGVPSGDRVWTRNPPSPGTIGVAMSGGSGRLVVKAEDGTLEVWDCASGETRRSIKTNVHGTRVCLTSDGTFAIIGEEPSALVVYPLDQDERSTALRGGDPGQVQSLITSPDGRQVAASSIDGRVYVWDLASGALRSKIDSAGMGSGVVGLAFSPDGTRLAAAGRDRVVRLFDTRSWNEVLQLRDIPRTMVNLTFDPTGECLAGGAWSSFTDQQAIVWRAPIRSTRH